MDTTLVQSVQRAVRPDRLLSTAASLIEVPSPTRSAAAVADRLESLLREDGFEVARPELGWPQAPAVVVRYGDPAAGRTLQFNGHLDTVHLPFVPPRVEQGLLRGSGASDMKGGVAAMVEALRVVRELAPALEGSVLLTAHELHEAPWGDGSQLDALIQAGIVGDGVLLPEYLADRLPIVGRGLAVLDVEVTRDGEPIHEVLGGIDQPSVIQAGAELIRVMGEQDRRLAERRHPLAGRESLFVGRVAGGEIYNQAPVRLELSGTRRWLPGTTFEQARTQYEQMLDDVSRRTGVRIAGRFQLTRDAFEISPTDPLVETLQQAHESLTGRQLPLGAKPFVDDGNAFASQAGVPAITHGPAAHGAHTVDEWVPVDELVRVAATYALVAMQFCRPVG